MQFLNFHHIFLSRSAQVHDKQESKQETAKRMCWVAVQPCEVMCECSNTIPFGRGWGFGHNHSISVVRDLKSYGGNRYTLIIVWIYKPTRPRICSNCHWMTFVWTFAIWTTLIWYDQIKLNFYSTAVIDWFSCILSNILMINAVLV